MITTAKQPVSQVKQLGWIQRITNAYWKYTDKQADQKIFWYMKAIIIIPSIYMVISVMAMAEIVDRFEWFIGLSTLVFFSNIMAHLTGASSRVFIPLYHVTTLYFVLVPLITY